MENKLSKLLAVTVLALGATACTESSVLNNPPGKYERTTRSVDSNGTAIEREASTEVEVDEYGNKKAVIETKTTKDPKGLFNKTTSESKQVIKESDY